MNLIVVLGRVYKNQSRDKVGTCWLEFLKHLTSIPGIAGIPGIPPVLDVVEVDEDIFEEENDEDDENDPSSLLVEVAINCEAEDESCLTAVFPSSVV